MQTYELTLKSPVSKSFRCQKAADSLDIDTEKKSIHHFKINADIKTDFNIGLIVGASGSGKTSLAKHIFGEKIFESPLKEDLPIIEQLPEHMDYESCVQALSGMGLTSVPCWIRPVYTLSNGQKARADAALMIALNKEVSVIDEWTSVVDRTSAKVMSHCVQKHARKSNSKIILLSCHYDVIEWLNPDWIIDCNKQTYQNRRSLRKTFTRSEKLNFQVRECSTRTWKTFSKYHYLSKNLPGGNVHAFGLFCDQNQIGFGCYANYVPRFPKMVHSNRVVIHPDYVGFGLGIKFVNITAQIMKEKGYDVRAKFSSVPMYKARIKDPKWKLLIIERQLKKRITEIESTKRQRVKVKTYSFKYIG